MGKKNRHNASWVWLIVHVSFFCFFVRISVCVLSVCFHRRSWTLSPPLCSQKTDTANCGRPRSKDNGRGRYLTHLCIWGTILYGRCNTKSTVRRLTVRTVHIWIVNICVCGLTFVGEIFVGPRLLMNMRRGVCGCVWSGVWGCVGLGGCGVWVRVCRTYNTNRMYIQQSVLQRQVCL